MKSGSIAVALALLLSGPTPAFGETESDPLLAGFESPPQSARPRIWWHWMNGNITEDGIAKDIAWMKRIGIGGLQNFDASLATPQVVEKRLVYMTPEWKKAFRFAAQSADAAGLEFAIAASPGWSETGGPWVKPEDGLKKISWSHTDIVGGKPFTGKIATPPSAIGPFQTLAEGNDILLDQGKQAHSGLFNDVALYAIPVRKVATMATAKVIMDDGQAADPSLLNDGDLVKTLDLGAGSAGAPPTLRFVYQKPRLLRAATLFMRDIAVVGGEDHFTPVLEARVGGKWQKLAEFELSNVPTTVAFKPVNASEYRVVFAAYSGLSGPSLAAGVPGAIIPPVIAARTGPAPVKIAEMQFSDEEIIDRFESKAGFSLTNDYYALSTTSSPDQRGISSSSIINLTGRLKSDGTLDWSPPKGNWRILRLGWSLTGKTNHPAPPEATGLEVDKLDGAAVERYLRHYINMYREAAGNDMVGSRGVRALLTDSTEIGAINWTPKMVEQFRKLRGYDPTPWLPALTGVLIETRKKSDQFLYDYRRTLADLHASEHYETVARVAHEYGLTVYGEAIEDRRPVIGDDMALRRYADIPMAAMWVWGDAAGVRPTLLGDMKGASSVGHFYGKNIIAAESMTSALAPWAAAPSDLRRVIDLEFAHGINRPVIHTSVHQPLDDKKPGLSLMIFGQFFNRHETWSEMAKPWIDYMSRSSYLLQQGHNVADVAYFYGEEGPITALNAYAPLSDTPTRYAYDFINGDGLIDGLRFNTQGRIMSPSGATYKALYLGGSSQKMTLPALRRIEYLVKNGAMIIGRPPASSPSLADNPDEFAAIVKRLWHRGIATGQVRGKVISSNDIDATMAAAGILPDADFGTSVTKDDVMFVHRALPDGDLYYVLNRSGSAVSLDARFRVTGKKPEIINAVDGSVTPTSYRQEGSMTHVPMELDGHESLFVLFRKSTATPEVTIAKPKFVNVANLDGPWTVKFQNDRAAPASAVLPELGSLTENNDPGIRYFSGEAVYSKSFIPPAGITAGEALWLDLGKVGDIAEVSLNGKKIGGAWEAPFRINIGKALRPGENYLEIKVANLWVNRLIGDAQSGAKKTTFVTIPTYRADAPLRPSGLMGPVQLLVNR
jgi:hypothetical protein